MTRNEERSATVEIITSLMAFALTRSAEGTNFAQGGVDGCGETQQAAWQ